MASHSTEMSKDQSSPTRPALKKSDSSTSTRSILRSSKRATKPAAPTSSHEAVKWNEENVKSTLHPQDKDYGLVKVSEPKTPYIYNATKEKGPVSAQDLAQRIEASRSQTPDAARAQREEDAKMSAAERERQLEFERKRKIHYDEFLAVKKVQDKIKKGECEEKAEDEVDQEETKKQAEAQVEEAKAEAAVAEAEAAAAAKAASAGKLARKLAEDDKKK
ncbi:uncharacterized protein LOC119161883 [Rhipicephalus microplus]|uniref:uncharacterized protein LOC119161883 n=1 Tax=Rhipicephalus microplus TaxID=6941 RepID=UPI003F6C11B8